MRIILIMVGICWLLSACKKYEDAKTRERQREELRQL